MECLPVQLRRSSVPQEVRGTSGVTGQVISDRDSHEAAKVADVLLETVHPVEACKWVCEQAVVCIGDHVPCTCMNAIRVPAVPMVSVTHRCCMRVQMGQYVECKCGENINKRYACLPCPLTK